MNFELPELHQSLRDSVRAFAENEIAPKARELDRKGEFSEVMIENYH